MFVRTHLLGLYPALCTLSKITRQLMSADYLTD